MAADMAGAGGAVAQPAVPRAAAQAQPIGKPRLSYIDNLRAVLITLVIVGHMAITYGAPIGDWYYSEEGEVGTVFAVLTMLLLGIGASFLLGLFFMIAGYFTPSPYDRKGGGYFILDRLKRLGIPMVFYALMINPLVTYWAAVHGGYEGSYLEYIPSHIPDLVNASIGPLWFVEALLIFSLVYALGRMLIHAIPKLAHGSRRVLAAPGNRSIAMFGLGLSLLTFLVRIRAPVGWWWEPIHQEPAHWPQYAAFFAAGIIAFRNNWFARMPTRQSKTWMWVALALLPGLPALMVAAGVLSGEVNPDVTGGFNALSLAYSLWEGFIGTALVVSALVWARERFNRQGRLMKRMGADSYAVYVLHPLLIVPLALALSGIQISLSLKFVLFAPLAVALCFLVAHYIRKIPLVRNII